MEEHNLNEALVELTGPDGKVYQFQYGATIPHEGQDYVVLIELEPDANGEEQILITRLEKHEEGQLAFVVESNEETVGQVFEKFMAMAVHSCGASTTTSMTIAIAAVSIIITRSEELRGRRLL